LWGNARSCHETTSFRQALNDHHGHRPHAAQSCDPTDSSPARPGAATHTHTHPPHPCKPCPAAQMRPARSGRRRSAHPRTWEHKDGRVVEASCPGTIMTVTFTLQTPTHCKQQGRHGGGILVEACRGFAGRSKASHPKNERTRLPVSHCPCGVPVHYNRHGASIAKCPRDGRQAQPT
jgi:hypothetical protein